MKLYRLKESGKFVGTQAEAKSSGEEWEPFEFPINPKSDTIEALNKLTASPTPKVDVNPLATDNTSAAMRTITENDDGKATVDQAIHAIMTGSLPSLGRYATAVSMRFSELAKKKRKKK